MADTKKGVSCLWKECTIDFRYLAITYHVGFLNNSLSIIDNLIQVHKV